MISQGLVIHSRYCPRPHLTFMIERNEGSTRSFMKRTITLLLMAAAACSIAAPLMHAQGCVVARSNGEAGGPEGEGGYLTPGEFELNSSYRHQFSFRHYVGDVEQTQRIAAGTQVENKINLENIDLTYQMTSRFAVSANVPVLSASRHSNNSAAMQFARGIGDTSFMVSGWIWNPKENHRGNVQLAFGLQLPTGNDRVVSYPDSRNGKTPVATYDDYSIQPGSGGYGIIMQWTAFKNVKAAQVYFNGSYLATPRAEQLSAQRHNVAHFADRLLLDFRPVPGAGGDRGSDTKDSRPHAYARTSLGRRAGEGSDRRQPRLPPSWLRAFDRAGLPVFLQEQLVLVLGREGPLS